MEYIKVNFPRNKENYISGNGEGMWVVADDETAKKYSANEKGTICFGSLANDSTYYPELKAGTKVTFELRGENRPVAVIDGFLEQYRAISDEEFEKLKSEIFYHNMLRTVRKYREGTDD